MRKFIFLITVIAAAYLSGPRAGAQPTGPEIVWRLQVYNSFCAQFTSDDKYIVANNSPQQETDSLLVIETATGKVVRSCYVPSLRYALRLSNNDSLIYSYGSDGIIYIHSLSDLKLIKSIDKLKGGSYYFDLSKNNSFISAINCNYMRKCLTVYDIIKDSVVFYMQLSDIYDDHFGKAMFFNNDNNFAVVLNRNIRIYDTKTWQIVKETSTAEGGHTKYIQDFDISGDETRIVTCANDGRIIIWDLETGEKIDQVIVPNMQEPNIRFYDKDIILISPGGGDNTQFYNLNIQKVIYSNKNLYSYYGFEVSKSKRFILSIEGRNYVLIDYDIATAINVLPKIEKILYPNPADSNLTVNFYLIMPSITFYEIWSNAGNIIKKKSLGIMDAGNQTVSINTSYLNPGMYFLKIFTDKDNFIFKFMVGR